MTEDTRATTFDFIIVGGGSAGCVLAARLSEVPTLTVLLIESGPDVEPGNVPDPIRTSYPGKTLFSRQYLKPGLKAWLGNVSGLRGPRTFGQYEQARVLGGGSSINGLLGNRGLPSDYDEWEKAGAHGWSWKDVLPYFRKLETDLQYGEDQLHGGNGPIPIHRLSDENITGFARHLETTLEARGHTKISDQNGDFRDGFMRPAITSDENGDRSTAAVCYLTDAVRRRSNLTILTDTTVERVLIESGVVQGVITKGKTYYAKQTIVSCGALFTPALLMRSGIGPSKDMAETGIEVVKHVPGLGQNLLDHPALGISSFIKPANRERRVDRHHVQLHLRWSSGTEDTPTGDMRMALLARSAWHDVGAQLGTFYFWVDKAYSRGKIQLDPDDPMGVPLIDFNLLSDSRDFERIRSAFHAMADLAHDPSLDAARHEVIPTAYTARVRAVSEPTRWNAFQTGLFARMLDVISFARAALIRRFIAPVGIADLLADDDLLAEHINKVVLGVWHACGTAKMGSVDDEMAVTDTAGRVYGVPGLRICDASLMPTIPCANTNLPTMMIAEKIADLIKAEISNPGAVH